MEITCPNCNFSKKIPVDKVPPGAKWAKCPQCNHRFDFTKGFSTPQNRPDRQEEKPDTSVKRRPSPWENRSELGIWQGIFSTFRSVLLSPRPFFKELTHRAGIGEPLAYGLLFGSIGSMLSFFWQFLLIPAQDLQNLSNFLLGRSGLSIIFMGFIIIIPLFVVLGMFFWGIISHICLVLVRSANGGFEATFRVIAFSQVTQPFGVIPFLGGFIAFIWGMVILIIGLKEIHETRYFNVIFALLIPFIFIILLIISIAVSISIFI